MQEDKERREPKSGESWIVNGTGRKLTKKKISMKNLEKNVEEKVC